MTGRTCGRGTGGAADVRRRRGRADRRGTGQGRNGGPRVEAGGFEVTGQCASHLPSITQSLCGSLKAEMPSLSLTAGSAGECVVMQTPVPSCAWKTKISSNRIEKT